MRGHLCAAVSVALLLIFLLRAQWFSGGARELSGNLTGDSPPVVRVLAFGWIDRLLLLLGVSGGIRRQPPSMEDTGATAPVVGKDTHGSPPLAADISQCHPSLSDGKRPVNCCPPRKDADQTLVDFKLPDLTSSPVRVRRPAHLVDEEYIARYERAVAIMKSLPLDHPHSFMRQANLHCMYCTGSYDQVNSSALFKIHRSWLFYPWHRAYTYFHERILGKLIGDDNFALPYWNWDLPEAMTIPEMYFRGSLNHSERDAPHLPPRVADLSYAKVESGLGAEEQVATNLAFMYHQMVSGARKAELFLGCKLRAGLAGSCDGPGTVELAPHNALHSWVGSGLNPEREDMGAFYSAARDPIFYAHHANIDRMWILWRSLRGHEPEFTDPEWLDSSFTFYDENLRFVRIRVRDVLDPAKLGYTYEDATMPWLNARPKPAMPPKVARAILKKRDEEAMSGLRTNGDSSEFGPQGRALDTTVATKVLRPKRIPAPGEEEVLVVYGIRLRRDTQVKVDVFVNLVTDERTAGPLLSEFAGTFVNTPRGATRVDKQDEGGAGSGTTLKLGISELLGDLGAEEDESVWVSLVPRAGSGADVTVDGVRIEYLS